MIHQFKSADERRQDWIKIYGEVETERRNSKKISKEIWMSIFRIFILVCWMVAFGIVVSNCFLDFGAPSVVILVLLSMSYLSAILCTVQELFYQYQIQRVKGKLHGFDDSKV